MGQNLLDVIDIQSSYSRLGSFGFGVSGVCHALDSYGPEIILYRALKAGEPAARLRTVIEGNTPPFHWQWLLRIRQDDKTRRSHFFQIISPHRANTASIF
jgi:hypothetical protein